MSVNANIGKAFARASDNLLLRAKRKYANLLREVCYAIVDGTPVDTGLLINNWYPTINKPSSRFTQSVDPSGNKSKVRVNNLISRIKLGQNFYFTNNTPYADIVEFGRYPNPPKSPTGKTVGGFSKQAPSGMLRVNLQKGIARARKMK
jgi:hypothetical protein